MKSPFFVSVDGPKGVGKSTLIAGVVARLRQQVALRSIVERELDPGRDHIGRILRDKGASIDRDGDLEVARLLARGRAWISRNVLVAAEVDLVITDRWYPSDAAFRRQVDFEECLVLNRAEGVAEPDLVVAASCRPEESWRRALGRHCGLDSMVIHSFEDHCRSTLRFRQSARQHGWFDLDTEQPSEVLSDRVAGVILEHMAA